MRTFIYPTGFSGTARHAANFFARLLSRLAAIALLASTLVFMPAIRGEASPGGPQYVLISFDGAHDLRQWERSRALASRTGARFTYFLSCTLLLSPETARLYRGSGKPAGVSNIGFAGSREEVAGRLQQIWSARKEGHEIASHGCGHFDGKDWTMEEWRRENAAFAHFLAEAWELNGIPGEPEGWQEFAAREITGFRAPYLSTNDAMFEALVADGILYDASTVSNGPAEPQASGGLVRFSLPLIPEGPRARPIIAMDYNWYVRHSKGEERPESAARFTQRTVEALGNAFEREYAGKRRPLQIGLHFTLMNGGAYWDALEQFAAEICTRADVECASHRDYLKTIDPAPQG